jgi:uncharacterized protein YbjT (DUF2867 family)
VTGGGGFLGSKIVSILLEAGYSVSSFSRRRYPSLVSQGVTCHLGDLADAKAVRTALAGADVVFHNAAKVGVWGSYNAAAVVRRAPVPERAGIDAAAHGAGPAPPFPPPRWSARYGDYALPPSPARPFAVLPKGTARTASAATPA